MINKKSEWLVPFKGRNPSGSTTQNFLWRQGNVYIMDNHRAALWCWLQEIIETNRVALLHIDEHYDTLYSRIEEWKLHLPSLVGLSIDEYLALEYEAEFGATKIIRWDTYLSLFLECFPNHISKSIFITHKNGDKPRTPHANFPDVWELAANVEYWINDFDGQWVINVDLDYFFCDHNEKQILLFSDEYIDAIFCAIRKCYDAGKVVCITICLTPDDGYTGGWEPAEKLCSRICRILGISFALPPLSDIRLY
ncbi:MAG: UPF0489 family protein [Undibacterium sp.]|uniref:UPF0489 family protein n=1 Tax=Undibacterium sp. TaxID=1914977 RepID=UPI0027174A73|nr:UPF0489 family protein [Undibacterium sp.]MDO8653447.1 UPF0489 family protein [Undibacterium sp.]